MGRSNARGGTARAPSTPAARAVRAVRSALQTGTAFGLGALAAGGAHAQAQGSTTAPTQSVAAPSQGGEIAPTDQRAPVSLITGVRAGVTLSDNLNLGPSGSERAGFVTEVTPYALYTAQSDRLSGRGFVAMRNFVRSEGDAVSVGRLELDGAFTARVYDDWLWLDASGRIANVAGSPIGPQSFDPVVYGVNTATFRSYSVSPYVRSRTPFFDYELRYRHTNSNIAGSSLGTALNSASANATTGNRLGRWVLGYFGDVTRVRLGDGRTLDRQVAVASVGYAVSSELQVGATANYEQIDFLRNDNGRDNGYGYGTFVNWRPNSRTLVSATYSHRYYGDTGSAAINWRTRRTTWNVTYARSVLSSVDASLLLFDPTGLGSTVPGQPGFNPIASRLFQQNLLLFGAQPLDVTLLSNALVLDKRLVATGGLTGLHNSLLATIYYNTRESAGEFSQTVSTGAVSGGPRGSGAVGGGTVANAFTGRLQQHGLTVGYQHRLDAATTANVTVRRNYTEVEGILAGFGPGGDTTLTQFLIGMNTRLTVDTTAGVGLRRTTQRRNGNFGADYTENALIGTLDMRF